MESGLRAATAQLKNRQRWFKLRLLSLLQGDQAREIVGAQTALGRRLTNTLAYVRRTESTVLLVEPKTLDAELLQEETEKARPGLTIFTDGPRPDDVATGYAVVWKNGQSWGASKRTWATTRRPTMQSAPPSQRRWRPHREDDPGAGHDLHRCTGGHQTHGLGGAGPRPEDALQARKHIAELRNAKPDITIEIRWCPAHKGADASNDIKAPWRREGR